MNGNGTILYNSSKEKVSIGIQSVLGGDKDDMWEAIRMLTVINDKNANKEYVFNYNLPKGYKLIKAEEWYEYFIKPSADESYYPEDYYVDGEVFIADNDGEIIYTIEPAWAYDANGCSVPTHYEIKGDRLIQIVDFDENTSFPVVADPTNHPDKTYYFYLNKTGVKNERNNYTGGTTANMASGILTLASAICITKGGVIAEVASPVAPALALVIVVGSDYNSRKYATWNKILDNFPSNKKYARIASTYKWHSGHKSYYPSGKLKATYTNKQW